MPGCVLKVTGALFEPVAFLATAALKPYSVFNSGEKVFPESPKSTKFHESGGFLCNVSDTDDDLRSQAQDAIAFLRANHEDLVRLASVAEVDDKYLDFGYSSRIDGDRVCVQRDYLSPELLKLAGELGIGILLSLYPPYNAAT